MKTLLLIRVPRHALHKPRHNGVFQCSGDLVLIESKALREFVHFGGRHETFVADTLTELLNLGE